MLEFYKEDVWGTEGKEEEEEGQEEGEEEEEEQARGNN